MTTHDDRHDDADVDQVAPGLAELLADDAVWAEADPDLEDLIVGAISTEAAQTTGSVMTPISDAPSVVGPSEGSSPRRWLAPIAAGIAAALVLIGGFVAINRSTNDANVEVVMEGTELAPGASAELGIETTANGTRMLLEVSGLPPAPEGKVYEAWMRQGPEVGVSAGTFHMRGGDGDLELWSGVLIEDYPLVTVTIQDEGDNTSSGQVVLRALVD